MKIKKKDLLSQLTSLQDQVKELSLRVAKLEAPEPQQDSVNLNLFQTPTPLQLNLFDHRNGRCQQCNNDLSKMSACMSVNCPYSFKVTCNV